MKSKIPPQTQVPTEHLSAHASAAKQRWHAALAAWETQIRQLSEANFVFRTVWEPSYREVWDKRYRALVEVTLLARQAWEGWRLTLESGDVSALQPG